MSTLLLKAPAVPPPMEAPTLKLLVTVLKNAQLGDPKFRSVNLEGKAGARLRSCPEALEVLASSGWVLNESSMVFPEGASTEAMAMFHSDMKARYKSMTPAAAPPAAAPAAAAPAAAVAPVGNLSLKQQARLDEEKAAAEARRAGGANKKKKTGMSMKQQARMDAERKAAADLLAQQSAKEELLRKLEADKFARNNDPNWSAAAAGDKGKGKAMQTFRDKHGEGE
ncbi:hypothetical protein TeGR_g13256 [Tetraparma gracilis]|uniref:PUB domain-containing protein n=1 Tax=Tetraparma gracilis TaxID=2962635 RepID=A0ABQ6M778_9STRA|nr:hypothetical protein TeGR_g13256 [Tetraparma gracilis]